MPSADFCIAVRTPYDDLSLKCQTLHRPPEVSYTAFTAQLPDLLPECPDEYGTSLSSANSSPRRQPHIWFLFVSSQFCSTLPSACTSRCKLCASLVLRPHLAGQGTFTPELCNMLGTHRIRLRLRAIYPYSLCSGGHPSKVASSRSFSSYSRPSQKGCACQYGVHNFFATVS